jgi:hypothetical protein
LVPSTCYTYEWHDQGSDAFRLGASTSWFQAHATRTSGTTREATRSAFCSGGGKCDCESCANAFASPVVWQCWAPPCHRGASQTEWRATSQLEEQGEPLLVLVLPSTTPRCAVGKNRSVYGSRDGLLCHDHKELDPIQRCLSDERQPRLRCAVHHVDRRCRERRFDCEKGAQQLLLFA